MTEQTDAAEVDALERLRASLRWHFNCHAAEPDKSYASLGIENAENIARDLIAAAEVRGAQAVLAAVEALADHVREGNTKSIARGEGLWTLSAPWVEGNLRQLAAAARAQPTAPMSLPFSASRSRRGW